MIKISSLFKKYYLFTWGSYFWGYQNLIIKARCEADAVHRFLQSDIQTRSIEHPHSCNGKDYNLIKDFDDWTVKEINLIK